MAASVGAACTGLASVQASLRTCDQAGCSGREVALFCQNRTSLWRPAGSAVQQAGSRVRAPKRTSVVRAAVAAPAEPGVLKYNLPTWTSFEMGRAPVYWECPNGGAPAAGTELNIFFNPEATELEVTENGIGFTGGFNAPAMCGDGEPRLMAKRERGANCSPFYSVKINVPQHAKTLEFSFTDQKKWHGPYQLEFQVSRQVKNMSQSDLEAALEKELSGEGCLQAIFPDTVPILDRCFLPSGTAVEGGNKCDLNIVLGCTDPTSPSYDPLAVIDDGSCELPLNGNASRN